MKKQLPVILSVFLLLIISALLLSPKQPKEGSGDRNLITKTGVCPPFNLFDEDGHLIDPVNGINADKPYSPKQTCGKCHDYNKITEGFHFQQGKDEQATGTFADRYQWVSTPGNYGGNWCSPAPLYNYLSNKNNTSAKEMDMTSFTFITNGCGTCHPGGGSMEYDREGHRYDKQMVAKGFTSGATNNFDGDYFQAHWDRSGVIEGDCNLCHLPEYDYKGRNDHLMKWNFRWMATAGSGLAKVSGSIKDTLEMKVEYDKSKFGSDGKVAMHLVREPRNETCLNCHSKPQWKKRGASFTAYTDVHIAKGVKCVDCHVGGSMAMDSRIKGKEVHQFGKGDDPSGNVRNDLDNTMRTCTDCHITGYQNAPIAKHSWLPPVHLEKIACQTCHIPERKVKSALAQMSDVYNPGVKISPPAKYVWTFYDQDMNYWNHYGELAQFTAKDQPSDPFTPQYANYKGQIFPVNPVHSAWPGIYTEGKNGLHQPKMKDIYTMWTTHRKDKTKYPDLSRIKDNNTDSIPEVNSPEEVDAFINSVTAYLNDAGYKLADRKVVWVNNDRMYFSGKDYKMLEKETFESSPYASVYKYSHDVAPAKAALGTSGCTDCHSTSSGMLFAQVVKYPFGDDGKPVTEPQYKRLGISGFMAYTGAFRESIVKPMFYFLMVAFLIFLLVNLLTANMIRNKIISDKQQNLITWLVSLGILGAGIFGYFAGDLGRYMFPNRMFLDGNHFLISAAVLLTGVWFYLRYQFKGTKSFRLNPFSTILLVAVVSGIFMLIKLEFIATISHLAYTLYDLSLIGILILCIFYLEKSSESSTIKE
ncbi:MAG TPA: hypothetical protein DHV48_00460 [Prolixibacteraceae bacterium]|nr:hypothetical protein [Prolixibacteraceae bacterium]